MSENKKDVYSINKQKMNEVIEQMRGLRNNDLQSLLKLLDQYDLKFSKDEILEIIISVARPEFGMYFTPKKIAELFSEIGEIYTPSTVIDICCGTGNILRQFNKKTKRGIDINNDIIKLAQYINSDVDFTVANALTYDFSNTKYDLVVGSLPFNAKTADGKPLEIELIKKGLKLLNENGVAIFVVSEMILMGSALAEFRRELMTNFAIDIIISLQAGTFFHTSIKTAMLVIRNGRPNQDIFMPDFDGNPTVIEDDFKKHQGDFYLKPSEIKDRMDRNYYLSLKAIEEKLRGHKLIKLSELSEIIRGKALDVNSFATTGRYISFNRKDKNGSNFINSIPDDRCLLRQDDIVVSLLGPNNKIYFYNENDGSTVITNNYAIIRSDSNKYIISYLKTEEGQNLLQQQINRHLVGTVMPHLTITSLSNIDIPLLSHEEVKELLVKADKKNTEQWRLLHESFKCVEKKDYDGAEGYINQAFNDVDNEQSQHKGIYLTHIRAREELEKKDQELEEKNRRLQEAQKELEEMMSMFAHKFRSPLDTIIYNTTHENRAKLYTEAAQTMRGLLDVFIAISTDSERLKERIKQDNQGQGRLSSLFLKTLDMMMLHLLSPTGAKKIRQHYLAYAKTQGQCTHDLSYKAWREGFYELEQQMQAEWEQSYAQLLNQSESLEPRLAWVEQHFFKLELPGFDNEEIQFEPNEFKESFLMILLNEILVNVFKYYSSEIKQPVVLEWHERDDYQVLSCHNPSVRSERSIIKGSGKGHVFLSTLARKTGSQFVKPKLQDDFVLEFGIPKELLLAR
jgi:type I restriction-modification system DNA methylase subunit